MSIWDSIREAIRGSQQDFTVAPIGTAVLLLAVPMVLETMMESVFAICDIFFVSRLGASAMATVGLTEAMIAVLYAVALGLGMGATATVARRIGEKDQQGASVAAVQSILMGCAFSLPIAFFGGLMAPHLLQWMGASPDVVRVGSRYTAIMFAGNASILLLFLINAIFRGAGNAAIAMRVLWFANAINIVLGPCLIFGLGPFPRLGVAGAATATTIGRGTGVLYQIWRLSRNDSRIPITKNEFRLDPHVMFSILRLSGTGILQALIGMTSWIGLLRILSSFGSAAVAGYTVGIRIIMFAILPAWGMSNAAATLVGQNLGAQKPDRAEESAWITCRYNFVFLGCVSVFLLVFAPFLIGLFTNDPAIARFGTLALRIISCGFVFYAYGMVLTQSINGAGDTRTPTFINLFCFWCWEIPIAYLLSHRYHLGPSGVFVAITIAFSTVAVISAIVFRTGRWKLQRV